MEKQRWEESEKRREEKRRKKIREEKDSEERRCSAKRQKSRETPCVSPMICVSGGSKSRLAKAAGAEPSGQMRDEKLHAVVARSIFGSQKCKKLTTSYECDSRFFRLHLSKVLRLPRKGEARSHFPGQHLRPGCIVTRVYKPTITYNLRYPTKLVWKPICSINIVIIHVIARYKYHKHHKPQWNWSCSPTAIS